MTAPALTVTSKHLEQQDITVLTLSGPLDGHTYDQLGTKLDRLIMNGFTRIVIDLAGCDYVSSAGVGVFVAARMKADHEKGCIVLLNLSEKVIKVFDVLQLQDLLFIATSMDEAIKILEANHP